MEVWRCFLGFLMPFLWALCDWLWAVWFFDLAISETPMKWAKKVSKIWKKKSYWEIYKPIGGYESLRERLEIEEKYRQTNEPGTIRRQRERTVRSSARVSESELSDEKVRVFMWMAFEKNESPSVGLMTEMPFQILFGVWVSLGLRLESAQELFSGSQV